MEMEARKRRTKVQKVNKATEKNIENIHLLFICKVAVSLQGGGKSSYRSRPFLSTLIYQKSRSYRISEFTGHERSLSSSDDSLNRYLFRRRSSAVILSSGW